MQNNENKRTIKEIFIEAGLLPDKSQEDTFVVKEYTDKTNSEMLETLQEKSVLTKDEKILQSLFESGLLPDSSFLWNGKGASIWEELKKDPDYPAQTEKKLFLRPEVYWLIQSYTENVFVELATGDGSGSNAFLHALTDEQKGGLDVYLNDSSESNNERAKSIVQQNNPAIHAIKTLGFDMNEVGIRLGDKEQKTILRSGGTAGNLSPEAFQHTLKSVLTKEDDKLFCTFYSRPKTVDQKFIDNTIKGYSNEISEKFVKEGLRNELKRQVRVTIIISQSIKASREDLIDRLIDSSHYHVFYDVNTNTIHVGLLFTEDVIISFPDAKMYTLTAGSVLNIHTSKRLSLEEVSAMCAEIGARVSDSWIEEGQSQMMMAVIDRRPYFNEIRRDERLREKERKQKFIYMALVTGFVLILLLLWHNSNSQMRRFLEERTKQISEINLEANNLNQMDLVGDTILFKTQDEVLHFLHEKMSDMVNDAKKRYAIDRNKISDIDIRRWINTTIKSLKLYDNLYFFSTSLSSIVDQTMMNQFVQEELMTKGEYGVFPYHNLVVYTNDFISALQLAENIDGIVPEDDYVVMHGKYYTIPHGERQTFLDNLELSPVQYLYRTSPIIREGVEIYAMITGIYRTPNLSVDFELIKELTKTYSTQQDLFEKLTLEPGKFSSDKALSYYVPKTLSDEKRKKLVQKALTYCVQQGKTLYGGNFEHLDFYEAVKNIDIDNVEGDRDEVLLQSYEHRQVGRYFLTSSGREVTIYISKGQIYAGYTFTVTNTNDQINLLSNEAGYGVLGTKKLGEEVVEDIKKLYQRYYGSNYVDYLNTLKEEVLDLGGESKQITPL